MSVITDVVIIVSCFEKAIAQLNSLMYEADPDRHQQFKRVGKDEDFGGYKVPCVEVYGASFNYFYMEKVINVVRKVKWSHPDYVLVYISDEISGISTWTPGNEEAA